MRYTQFIQFSADIFNLIYGVRFCGAIQDTNLLHFREEFLNHGRLLIQRSQVGSTGYIGAGSAGPVSDVQSGCIVRDGCADDRTFGSRLGGSDGRAVRLLALCVLEIELHVIFTESFLDSVLETFRSSVQSRVLQQLNHADGVRGISARILGCCRAVCGCAAAACQCEHRQHSGEYQRNNFLLSHFLPPE